MNRRSSKQSRQNIIDSASRVFSIHGYAGTTMRMIADDAGISVGGIYLYFKNKEQLCLFLIREKFGEYLSIIETAIESLDNPLDALRVYINMSIEYAKQNREFIITESREQGFTFGIEMKKNFFKRQKTLVMEIIRKGIDRGIFVRCDPEEVTKVIMGILRGFVLSVVVDPDNLFGPEECCRLILYGLLKTDEAIV